MYRFISSRPQVTLKKNRSEMIRTLNVDAETASFVI
jgi:ssDNA-specific exonuclease RecJ